MTDLTDAGWRQLAHLPVRRITRRGSQRRAHLEQVPWNEKRPRPDLRGYTLPLQPTAAKYVAHLTDLRRGDASRFVVGGERLTRREAGLRLRAQVAAFDPESIPTELVSLRAAFTHLTLFARDTGSTAYFAEVACRLPFDEQAAAFLAQQDAGVAFDRGLVIAQRHADRRADTVASDVTARATGAVLLANAWESETAVHAGRSLPVSTLADVATSDATSDWLQDNDATNPLGVPWKNRRGREAMAAAISEGYGPAERRRLPDGTRRFTVKIGVTADDRWRQRNNLIAALASRITDAVVTQHRLDATYVATLAPMIQTAVEEMRDAR